MVKPRRTALAAAVGLAALSLSPSSRADWKFTPRVDLRETYTDNVLLAEPGKERSQAVTQLSPGFSLSNVGPRLDLSASYSKHLVKYSDSDLGGGSNGGAQGNTQQLQANLKARLLGESLFLDSTASISQQAKSAFGPTLIDNGVPGSGFAAGVSSEVKSVRISPYYLLRFGSFASGELRYARDRVSSDNTAFGTSNGDNLSLNLGSGPSFHVVGWGLTYYRQELTDTISAKSSSQNLSGTLTYLYSPQLTLSVSAGYDQYDYASQGGRTKGQSWSVGGTWAPNLRTRVQASIGKRYFGDSYSLVATHRARASVWSVNYNDGVTTSRSQFLLPSTIDTAALLDQMFQAAIPDPAARRQAVQAYMQSAGLPPSLANSVNYLSNRYMLQKQATASAAFNGARGTLILSLVDSRRSGLSVIDVDAGLLGATNNTLNENTHQTAATATVNWRLSPYSSVNLGASRNKSRSLASDRVDNNTSYRLNLTRQFARNLHGSIELRKAKGATAVAGRGYTENAVSASLNKLF
ncbi:TIGR03016 family PEP-CTERM system-associated outer membrane protein [Pseudoduganella sp. LjRoot289]|uniref:TIGR03016 family PEP-CTERM system-associated outer membrane protein n=1 Tax=Pseudoduganella sp. LjRoot289 TaxID=3342314 RepID=UPI003ECD9C9D